MDSASNGPENNDHNGNDGNDRQGIQWRRLRYRDPVWGMRPEVWLCLSMFLVIVGMSLHNANSSVDNDADRGTIRKMGIFFMVCGWMGLIVLVDKFKNRTWYRQLQYLRNPRPPQFVGVVVPPSTIQPEFLSSMLIPHMERDWIPGERIPGYEPLRAEVVQPPERTTYVVAEQKENDEYRSSKKKRNRKKRVNNGEDPVIENGNGENDRDGERRNGEQKIGEQRIGEQRIDGQRFGDQRISEQPGGIVSLSNREICQSRGAVQNEPSSGFKIWPPMYDSIYEPRIERNGGDRPNNQVEQRKNENKDSCSSDVPIGNGKIEEPIGSNEALIKQNNKINQESNRHPSGIQSDSSKDRHGAANGSGITKAIDKFEDSYEISEGLDQVPQQTCIAADWNGTKNDVAKVNNHNDSSVSNVVMGNFVDANGDDNSEQSNDLSEVNGNPKELDQSFNQSMESDQISGDMQPNQTSPEFISFVSRRKRNRRRKK